MKALDVRRDPRFAVRSRSADPSGWRGDAEIAGRVAEITDPEVVARATAATPRRSGARTSSAPT